VSRPGFFGYRAQPFAVIVERDASADGRSSCIMKRRRELQRERIVFLACLSWPTLALADEPIVSTFSNQTQSAGVAFTHDTSLNIDEEVQFMNPGGAAADFNNDGWIDLFLSSGTGQNAALFINNGDGTFTDLASAWGIDTTPAEGTFAATVDVDGNGYTDLYAGAIYGRNYLYINTGNNSFIESAFEAGVAMEVNPPNSPFDENTFGATFGDIDLDGDPDLYVCTWAPLNVGNILFENKGDGTFADITISAGVHIQGQAYWPFSPSLVDMNDDRFPELLVAADFLTSRYFSNNTDSTFTELTDNGTGTDENGMGSAIADYDGDGDLDWFVTSIFDEDGKAEGNWGITGNRLYRNDGNHQFTDVTDEAGVRDGDWGWGASFGDLNNDGWLDLVMTNGFGSAEPFDSTFVNDPTRLWLNTGVENGGGPTFTEVAAQAGVNHTADGKGVILFDYDNDGDLDLALTSNQGAFVLYRNDLNVDPNRWIEFDFVSPAGNAPNGMGAKITLNVNGETRVHVVHGGSSYMTQNPTRAHFGLPSAVETIDSVHVRWPDGSSKWWYDVPTGQIAQVSPGNVNGDDTVDVADLLAVLNEWGPCDACATDLNDDGAVDTDDLLIVFMDWG